MVEDAKTEIATFAAGCFWGVEMAFRRTPGVVSTKVGYTGGRTESPTYEDVCTDTTGHAEAVRVTYDPNRIRYEDLLNLFFEIHDPTQVNRQGPDVGSQYRSAVFFHTPEQEAKARAAKEAERQTGRHRGEVATEITPAGDFHKAEDYHQRFFEKRGGMAHG